MEIVMCYNVVIFSSCREESPFTKFFGIGKSPVSPWLQNFHKTEAGGPKKNKNAGKGRAKKAESQPKDSGSDSVRVMEEHLLVTPDYPCYSRTDDESSAHKESEVKAKQTETQGTSKAKEVAPVEVAPAEMPTVKPAARGRPPRRGRKQEQAPEPNSDSSVQEVATKQRQPVHIAELPKPKRTYSSPSTGKSGTVVSHPSTELTSNAPEVKLAQRDPSPTHKELASRVDSERAMAKQRLLNSPRGAKLMTRLKNDYDFVQKLQKTYRKGKLPDPETLTMRQLEDLAILEYNSYSDKQFKFRSTRKANDLNAINNIQWAWDIMMDEKDAQTMHIEVDGVQEPVTMDDHVALKETLIMAQEDTLLGPAFDASPDAFDIDAALALLRDELPENKEYMKIVWSEWKCKTIGDVMRRVAAIESKVSEHVGKYQGSPILSESDFTPSRAPKPTLQVAKSDEVAARSEVLSVTQAPAPPRASPVPTMDMLSDSENLILADQDDESPKSIPFSVRGITPLSAKSKGIPTAATKRVHEDALLIHKPPPVFDPIDLTAQDKESQTAEEKVQGWLNKSADIVDIEKTNTVPFTKSQSAERTGISLNKDVISRRAMSVAPNQTYIAGNQEQIAEEREEEEVAQPTEGAGEEPMNIQEETLGEESMIMIGHFRDDGVLELHPHIEQQLLENYGRTLQEAGFTLEPIVEVQEQEVTRVEESPEKLAEQPAEVSRSSLAPKIADLGSDNSDIFRDSERSYISTPRECTPAPPSPAVQHEGSEPRDLTADQSNMESEPQENAQDQSADQVSMDSEPQTTEQEQRTVASPEEIPAVTEFEDLPPLPKATNFSYRKLGGPQGNIHKSVDGKRRQNPPTYKGIPIKRCPEEERENRAMPEPERATEGGLTNQELYAMFDRSVKVRSGMKNNDPRDYIEPKDGEVYIFDVPHGMDIKQAKHEINVGDPYIWRNCGDKPKKKDGITKNYLFNEDENQRRTNFGKRIHISDRYPDKVIVEYIGHHTTGLVRADRYYAEAVAQWKYQEALNAKLAKKTAAAPTARGDTLQAHQSEPVLPSTQAGKEDDSRSIVSISTIQPDFHSRLRAATYPLPVEDGQLREAIPALTKVTPPGQSLEIDQVHALLNSKEEDAYHDYKFTAITDPKDGDVYLFNFAHPGKTKWFKNVKKDTYRWKMSTHENANGADFVTHKSYLIQKDEQGKDHATSKFTRYIHYDTKRKRCAVHYTGDLLPRRDAHGNTTNPNTQYIPARDMVKELIEKEGLGATTREILLNSRGAFSHQMLEQLGGVRDSNQIRYNRRKDREAYKLIGTERQNAQNLADYWGPNMIKEFKTNPIHIEIVNDHVVKEVAKLTKAHVEGDRPLLFHYDTTYNCGQYYVSTLSMRHPLIKHRNARGEQGTGEPVIPIAHMIHQNRLQANHKEVFETVTKVLDAQTRHAFSNTPKVLVSDAEFRQGIWEGAHVAQCWRHLSGNIELQCKNRGMSLEERNEAKSAFFSLAKSKSERSFDAKLDEALEAREGPWANPWFAPYMQNYVVKPLRESSGRWILEDLKLNNVENGLTNNAAEGCNTAYKAWLRTHNRFLGEESNKVELYQVMMACKQYSDNEITKVVRAYYDRSPEYELKEEYRDAFALDQSQMPALRFESHQETIRNLKEILGDKLERFPNLSEPEPTKADRRYEELQRQKGLIAAANELLEKNKTMQFVKEGRYYHMVDEFDQPFDLHLGDRNECSCSSSTDWCAHLIAGRFYWGMSDKLEVPETKKQARIPPPQHPNTQVKQRPSAKAPKPSDFNDPFQAKRGTKRKEERPTSRTLKQKIAAMDDAKLMPPPSEPPAKPQRSPFAFPKRQQTKFEQMTRDLAQGLGQYSQEEIRDIAMQEQRRCREIRAKIREEEAVIKHAPTGGDFASLNQFQDEHFRDKRLILQSFRQNHAKMNVQDFDFVKVQGGEEYGFACTAPGKVSVYGTNLNEEAMTFAARAIQHQQPLQEVSFYKSNSIRKDTMEAKKEESALERLTVFQPQCYCREPTPIQDTALIRCYSCPTRFHSDCVNGQNIEGDWTCPKEKLPISGVQWSAGSVLNTCTIDNFLTAVTLKCIEDPAFQDYITRQKTYTMLPFAPSKDEGNIGKMLDDCINLAKQEAYGAAQETYANVAKNKFPAINKEHGIDLYGSESNYVFNLLQEGGQFKHSYDCTKCSYTAGRKPTHEINISQPCYIGMIKEQIEHGSFESYKCRNCPNGLTGKGPLQVVDENNPPWFLHVETDMSGYRIREATWCPKEIVIQDKFKYNLAYVTTQSSNHFSSIQNFQGMLMKYDGQGNPQDRKQKFSLIPDDQLHQEYNDKIVSAVTYFLDSDCIPKEC